MTETEAQDITLSQELERVKRERDALANTLAIIGRRAADDLTDMPVGKVVPFGYAQGTLLTIQALASHALGLAD